MNKNQIVIFDLCGVLVQASYKNIWKKHFNSLIDFEKDESYYSFTKGAIDAFSYYQHFILTYKIEICFENFCEIWNSFFIEETPGIEKVLNNLSIKYPLFILSNLDIIHYIYFENKYSHLSKHFSKAYYSFFLGIRKPDPKIFQLISDFNKADFNNIIFVDDKISNIETASKMGINAIHFVNSEELISSLHSHSLI